MPERRWPMYRLPKTVKAAQRRIARHMRLGRRRGKRALLTCAACGADWGTSSPGDCPSCQRYSYAVNNGS